MAFPLHRLLPAVAVLACGALLPAMGSAQSAGQNVSPVAPPTLRAPVFDTTTPTYNMPPAKKADRTVVAEVDGRPITLGEVASTLKDLPQSTRSLPYDQLFPLAQNRLINVASVVIMAQREGIDDDPAIRRQIQDASDAALSAEYLRREAARRITEQALLDRYARTVAGKPGPAEVQIRIILVPTEAAAADIIKQLKAGADFAALAKQFSADVTASSGGNAGFVQVDKLTPELNGAVRALAPGEVSANPVPGPRGWFVVKAGEWRNQPTPAFSAVREQLLADMTAEMAPQIIQAAVKGRTIRFFTVAGKEIQALPSDSATGNSK